MGLSPDHRVPIALCAILLCVLALGLASPAHAQIISLSSGTGFFISREGHVVTNHHVIERCKSNLQVQGTIGRVNAQLVAADATNDLALLKAGATPANVAKLRDAASPLKKDEALSIIGFPGNAGAVGNITIADAKVVSDQGPNGEEKWIQFSDSVQHGNSGGPLLDASGHVAGVIMAKSENYVYNATAARQERVGQTDIAISLATLRPFLMQNRVLYATENSSTYMATHRVLDRSREFIVLVQCQVN